MAQGRFRALVDRQVERIAAAVRVDEAARLELTQTARELAAVVRTPWRVRATKSAIAAAATRGLDRIADVVVRHPAPVTDAGGLEQRANQVRRGISAALTAVQGVLATSTAATDGVGAPPAVAVDAAVAQVASVLTGLAEWYLVGSYAVNLMRKAGIEPDARRLRLVVNAALLSRDRTLDARMAQPDAEPRLIARWIGRGVLEAVPFLSAYPTQRVRRAGERLEAVSPHAWPAEA